MPTASARTPAGPGRQAARPRGEETKVGKLALGTYKIMKHRDLQAKWVKMALFRKNGYALFFREFASSCPVRPRRRPSPLLYTQNPSRCSFFYKIFREDI